MQQYLEFFGNHPGLVMAFLAVLGGLVWTLFQGAPRGVSRIGPGDATRLINHEDAIVVDVRTDGEYRQGHVLNALHVPETQLDSQIEKLGKYRERPIITVCRTGQSGAKVAGALRKHGFEKVYTLSGGIAAWESASLPLSKK